KTGHGAGSKKAGGLLGDFFLFNDGAGSDRGQRRAYDSAVAVDAALIFLGRSVGNGGGVKSMHRAIRCDDASTQRGTFLVPRLPTVADVGPAFRTPLRNHFINEILGVDASTLGVKDVGFFFIQHKGIRTGGRCDRRNRTAQGLHVVGKSRNRPGGSVFSGDGGKGSEHGKEKKCKAE